MLYNFQKFHAVSYNPIITFFSLLLYCPIMKWMTVSWSVVRFSWRGFPNGSDSKKICLKCGRYGFDPWGWEDLLENGMASHSSILVWRVTKSQTGLSNYTYIHTYIHTQTHTPYLRESCKLVVASSIKKLLQGMYRGPCTILRTQEGK